MPNSDIIITNLSAEQCEEDAGMLGLNVKEEMANDDILFFTAAEMEAFTNDSNNFPSVQDIVNNSESITGNATYNLPDLDDGQVSQLLASTENFTKFPIDLSQFCKFEAAKSENSAHFIKYKMQDGKQSKIWECGICAKEFGHQYTLMRHLPTHTDERKFQCNVCGKAFRQMSTLSQHRAIHSADRPYVCEICHKTFNRVSTLISHRKTHTGLKPHRCHLCNKAFHQKGNLRNHIFTHTNERPYKCDICAKGFNQMSNLMCHKVKAHQRADKPRYMCQICGKDFQKRMGLRNHEQYQHGVQNLDPVTSSSSSTRIKYTNGVLVDPITTAAMQLALATNQTPFALLRPLHGIPVLVRVLAAGEKQMLVPATAEDLKKHGQITITPQVDDEQKKTESSGQQEKENIEEDTKSGAGAKTIGSTVQIKIPVVATVVQRCGKDGNVCMAIESPGPNNENALSENYTVTSSSINPLDETPEVNISSMFESSAFNGVDVNKENVVPSTTAQIEYVDEYGNVLTEEEFKAKNSLTEETFQFNPSNNVFASRFEANNDVIDVAEDQQSILREIDTENVMDISYMQENDDQMFNIDHQVVSLSDRANLFGATDALYDGSVEPNFVLPPDC